MNENLKKMVADIMSVGYEFEEIVMADSTNRFIKNGLLESIFNICVRNTAMNSKLTKTKLSMMREMLTQFEEAIDIEVTEYDKNNGDLIYKRVFKFSKFMSEHDINGWVITTSNLLSVFTEKHVWFEDTLNNGFCCKTKNGNYLKITYSL